MDRTPFNLQPLSVPESLDRNHMNSLKHRVADDADHDLATQFQARDKIDRR
jgi:hypothetical protein